MSSSASIGGFVFWTESLAQELQLFLLGRLRCSETAADLTHETFLRLQRRATESPPDNARALAYRIALNLAIDYQRKAAVKNRYMANVDYDTALDRVSVRSNQPDRNLMAQERLSILHKALGELPVNCRTAFHLHSIEGLKYSEIAVRMGISKSMVNKLLAQAMKHCAEQLDD